MGRAGRIGAALLVVASLAVVGRARAEPAAAAEATEAERLDAARRTFFEALAEQEAGHFDQALALYAKVEEVVVSPPLLFNIGECEQQRGSNAAALAAFERARDRAKAEGDAEVLALAEARIAKLSTELARVAPAEPRREMPASEPPSPPRSAPPIRRETSAAPPVSVAPSYVPAIVAGAATALLTGGAIVTGIAAHDDLRKYETLNAAPTTENRAEREDLRSSGQTLRVANAVFFGTALIAAGVTTWFLVRPPRGSASRAQAFDPVVRF